MHDSTISRPASIAIGAAVYQPVGAKIGHVAKLTPSAANSFSIGAGGLTRTRNDAAIVFSDGTMATIPDSILADWLTWAAERRIPAISEAEAAERLKAAEAEKAAAYRRAIEEREQAAAARKAFIADAAGKIPTWAKAVIVAELIEDQSDSMTDYFGSTTRRSVILGFSKHGRDLFPELRKAAANFAETANLVDAPESAEHREKYSMGGGYYLKAGGRHSSGWRVSKRQFYGTREPAEDLPFPAEWSLAAPEPQASPMATDAPAIDGIRIEEHTHTKKGFQMFICIMPERVDREDFLRLRDLAQALGGWYSKPWGRTPGGFAFKDRAAAETFASPTDSTPDDDGPKGRKPAADRTEAPARGSQHMGEKLRAMAAAMQAEIDNKFRDRLTNTPKRQREAASARLDGYRLQRAQKALRALADLHEAGNVPPELASVRSKAAALELVATKIVHNGGYYDAGRDTGEPYRDTPATRAIFAMIGGRSEAEAKAEDLRRKVQALQFANIPGYFPTPRAVIDQMLERADIPYGPCDVLEPEGGSGAILDAIKEAAPDAILTTYERHVSLRDVLALKGYALAGSDFLEAETGPRFDRVLMNPPFENGQDMEHVRHAFAMLRDGGRLVAIMSPGPFFRQDRKAQEFRAWFDALGGEKIDLPAGSFKESGTGTGTVLVIIDAEG